MLNRDKILAQIPFEKHRPKSFDEYIAPPELKAIIDKWLSGRIQHVIMESKHAGTGKSTLTKLLINELNATSLWLNTGMNNSIDTVRTKVSEFISHKSRKKIKFVIMDEADGLSPEAMKALRGMFEDFGKGRNTRFFLTCNDFGKIDPYIRSRSEHINFDQILMQNKKFYCNNIMKILVDVCQKENIEYVAKAMAKLITTYFPDMRQMFVVLEQYSHVGINERIFMEFHDALLQTLQDAKQGNFKNVRLFVEAHNYIANRVISELYSKADTYFTKDPKAAHGIIALSETQSNLKDCIDARIPLCALFIHLANIGCIK